MHSSSPQALRKLNTLFAIDAALVKRPVIADTPPSNQLSPLIIVLKPFSSESKIFAKIPDTN